MIVLQMLREETTGYGEAQAIHRLLERDLLAESGLKPLDNQSHLVSGVLERLHSLGVIDVLEHRTIHLVEYVVGPETAVLLAQAVGRELGYEDGRVVAVHWIVRAAGDTKAKADAGRSLEHDLIIDPVIVVVGHVDKYTIGGGVINMRLLHWRAMV